MASKRQKIYIAKHQSNGSRKMKASRRVLKGGRRYFRRELSFGMRKKIRYRTSFQPLVIFYDLFLYIPFSGYIKSRSATLYLMSPSPAFFFSKEKMVEMDIVHKERCVILLLTLLGSTKTAFP